ncbi:hypothetical protein NEIMUCOT_06702 [Neisseria mucosa ATCC 25996]|uniref:Uncharacterized protein n=1 Tax=Neisseria mucosa (strain ATCC 25996 / DSM 4631 / NCTC 10774 / M26) TaxID=546266 RepID=D3A1A9_NEIM2|nr:hypothetical protein NEIMUCOT_06702 [Neisseria mucosa ATCC 25996]
MECFETRLFSDKGCIFFQDDRLAVGRAAFAVLEGKFDRVAAFVRVFRNGGHLDGKGYRFARGNLDTAFGRARSERFRQSL